MRDEHLVSALYERLQRHTGVNLRLKLWNGQVIGPLGASSSITLTRPWSARAILRPPIGLALGEAYVEGVIDFNGDIISLIYEFAALETLSLSWREWLALIKIRQRLARPPSRSHPRRAQLTGKVHSRSRDRAAIAFHYDLPQRFYEQFLDKNLVYSCAYFSDMYEDLESAQRRKLDLICRKLRLRPGLRLLDVGCGWGSLLIHAARRYGIRGVGITLSTTQFETGRERIARAGLADRVEIRLQDYRDVEGTFDAISSIGMLEHVGPQDLPSYAKTLRRLLIDGGLLLNHGIVFREADRKRVGTEATFLTKYVFPDGGLAAAWRLVEACERADLRLIDLEQLGPHYALTLRRWLAKLEENYLGVLECASEEDYRIWRAYMAMAAVGFESEQLGVVQLLTMAPGGVGHELPLSRDWMSPVADVRDENPR